MRKGIFSVLAAAFLTVACSTNIQAEDGSFFEDFRRIDGFFWHISDGWANGKHQACEWTKRSISLTDPGMLLTLSNKGGKVRPLGCPEIHTYPLTGFGVYESRMRTAAGSGLNTNMFTFIGPPTGSPEHDEIDFEFLGKDPETVSITHYVNGKNIKGETVHLGFDASKDFHDYAIEWTPHAVRWYVDRKLVHETAKSDPIPRNKTRLYFSLWAGSSIEDAWMGPFKYVAPLTAAVAWAAYTPEGKTCLFPQSVTCQPHK